MEEVLNVNLTGVVYEIICNLRYQLHLLRLVIHKFCLCGLPRYVLELATNDGVPCSDDVCLKLIDQAQNEHANPGSEHHEVHGAGVALH